jgi:prepilin peptidase CpaA
MTISFGTLVASAFVGGCMVSDVRTRRIPNAFTGPAILAGLALNAWTGGWSGFEASLGGLAIAIVLLLGPFALGGIGGGDVKMMGAIGALLGPQLVLRALVAGLALGGVVAVVHLARHAQLGQKLANIGRMLANAILSRSFEPLRLPTTGPTAVLLPYSVPLGVGTLGVIALSVISR